MSKLNCSFPWLKSYVGPLQKCGSENYVKDLVNYFGRIYNSDDEITNELNDFGCTIPNCESVTWLETNKIAEQLYEDRSYTKINLNFPSDSKVSLKRLLDKYKTHHFSGSNYQRIFSVHHKRSLGWLWRLCWNLYRCKCIDNTWFDYRSGVEYQNVHTIQVFWNEYTNWTIIVDNMCLIEINTTFWFKKE